MDALFDISMLGLLAGLSWAAFAIVRRTRQRRSAWESGLTAQARVVRAWVTTQVVNNAVRRVQWHEYDFTTLSGGAVRFKEAGGPRERAVGDSVRVHYAPHEPDRATAAEPQPGKDVAAAAVWLTVIAGCAIYLVHEWVELSRF
ncbi:hypothetical protein GT045_17270 [Streptomyces sp. SID486]|nr:hypothetical protein [Streptomyces sp. SID2955]MYW42671.1 hypothetical protein [Streptomyces sp. SID161]MYX96516.1 hypothetical protein [Streptomyces sp. SID486]